MNTLDQILMRAGARLSQMSWASLRVAGPIEGPAGGPAGHRDRRELDLSLCTGLDQFAPRKQEATMYIPSLFREEDHITLHALIRGTGLAMLASNGRDGLPEISYLPLLLDERDGAHGSLLGHLARANPHWQSLAESPRATAIFNGADAYISPGWYPTKQVHHKHVPTWNYEVVHAVCRVEIFDDPARLRDVVARLTRRYEAGRADPWTIDQAPADYIEAMLKAIGGVKLWIEEFRGKRKLSQNRAPEDRQGVRDALAASSDAGDQAVFRSMRELHEKEQSS
jgi:transcriptional regulator